MADVLLVDDDAGLLLTLGIALRRRGHDVTQAADGTHALEEMTARHFDCLVSDIKMPGMSGVELAQRARRRDPGARIILTSAQDDHDLPPGLADAFLPKPVSPQLLDSLLHDGA